MLWSYELITQKPPRNSSPSSSAVSNNTRPHPHPERERRGVMDCIASLPFTGRDYQSTPGEASPGVDINSSASIIHHNKPASYPSAAQSSQSIPLGQFFG